MKSVFGLLLVYAIDVVGCFGHEAVCHSFKVAINIFVLTSLGGLCVNSIRENMPSP